MADRKPVKKQHERAVVRQFIARLNSLRGAKFKVISEPDPPDAIIQSVRAIRWIEVTDAFYTSPYAEDLYSYATPGEKHRPAVHDRYAPSDELFARRFVKVLSDKLNKRSYLPYVKKYGTGYLIVVIQYPFFDGRTLLEMKNLWRSKQPVANLGCFKEIYIAYSSMNNPVFRKWKV